MRRALQVAIVTLLGIPLAPVSIAADSDDLLAVGQTAYDEDRFAEAAEAFAKVLAAAEVGSDSQEQADLAAVADRAAYLLTSILFYQDAADVAAIVGAVEGLDPGLEPVARAVREKKLVRASHSLAFLRFRKAQLPRATQRLLETMEAHTGPVEDAFVQVWDREVAHAADLCVDARGRLWVLAVRPTAFLRLDQTGKVVERVPFVAPDALDASSLAKAHFVVRPDGGFQLGAHRYAADGSAVGSARVYPPDDAVVTANGATVFLHNDGLRAVGPEGDLRWRKLGRGRRQGSFNHPLALTLDGDGIVVAELRRLQRFSMKGEFQSALGGEAATRLPDGFRVNGLNDVSSAAGRIFVGHLNARTVEVYSSGFQPIASFRLPARRLAASADGMVFGLRDERLSAAIEVPAASRKRRVARFAPQEQPREPVPRERWQSEITPVAFVPLEPPPSNVRVHVSTQHVTSLARGASGRESVWIGTLGGLLRWQPGTQGDAAWRHWSRMDGFPSDVVHDVHEGPEGTVWVVASGAVLKRAPGASGWSRLERNGFPVNGKAIIADRRRPGFVWIAAQRGLFHLDAQATEAGFVPMERSPEEVIELPDGQLFVRLGVNGVAAVDPGTGETAVWVEMEDLGRVPGLREPSRDRWIMTLSADPEENVLWLGTDQRELFALDLATRRLRGEWIDGAIRPSCSRGEIRARRIGGTLHLLGFGCHAVRESGSDRPRLVFEHPGRGLDLLDTDPVVLLATSEGLYRIDEKGPPTRIARPVSEPPDWAPISVAKVDGRIWVGFGNQGIGIYDGARWREIEGAQNVGRLRVGSDGVLAVAHYGVGGAYRIGRDGNGLEPVGPGGRSWSYLRDLLYDGEQWWGVGGPDPVRKHGIRRFRAGRDEHWGRAAGMPFGEARRIAADPARPGTLWLASDVGLVRLEKETRRTQVVWPGDVRWLERFDDGSLWAHGSGLLRFDPETGLGSPFPFSGIPAPDPDDAAILWMVHEKKLLRLDTATGGVLSSHEIGLGSLHVRGLAILSKPGGWSAWIVGGGGLVEVRVARDSVPGSPTRARRGGVASAARRQVAEELPAGF